MNARLVALAKHPLLWALCASTGLKLWLAATTFGTNDVKYWQTFMHYVVEHDSVSIYRAIEYYNHPPFMSLWLWLLHRTTRDQPELFPFLFRLPAILADIGSSVLVLRLASHFRSEREALNSALCVALSPVLVFVSGFHGNTDPVFVFLLLWATERLAVKERPLSAGFAAGVALSIKIVPLLCAPHFAAVAGDMRARVRLFAAAAVALLLGFGYHFSQDADAITRNVFLYGSLSGAWGLSYMLPAEGLGQVLKLALLIVLVGVALLVRHRFGASDRTAVVERACVGLGLVFLVFLVLTPGFGVQYLAWLVAPGALLNVRPAWVYNALAGAFLFAVYTYWSGGFPWYDADSDLVGPWRGPSETLALVLWCFLAAWLGVALARLVGLKHPFRSETART